MVVITIRVRQEIQLPSIEESKMSIDLVNSVVNSDYVLANNLFEERLANILEKKLYERKRMLSAKLYESATRLQQDREDLASGRKVRASDVWQDPRKTVTKHKEIEDAKKSASDSSTAEKQRTRQLKKLPSLANMQKAERAKKLARITARAERLKQRGHTNAYRHLQRAKGKAIGEPIGKAIANTTRAVGKGIAGAASEIGSQLAPSGF